MKISVVAKNGIAMTVIQQAVFSFSWCVRVNKALFWFCSYGSWGQGNVTSERPQLDCWHVSLRNLFSLLGNLGAQLNLLVSKIFSSSNCQSSNFYFIRRNPLCMPQSIVECSCINRFMIGVWGYLLCTEGQYCIQFIFIFKKLLKDLREQGKELPKWFMSCKKYLIPWEVKKLAC